DILATGAEPLFFLDYIAIGKMRSELISEIVSGVAQGCCLAGCALIGGEMAEHPGVMGTEDYDLSGFCVGIVDRPCMLDPANVRAGDLLLGLASSGLHSNGYSLARKVCVEGKTHYELRLERPALGGMCVQDALLIPTRIYVKPVRSIMAKHPGAVRSLAHITGGGITENLNRAMPEALDALVELGTWEVPPIAAYVCRAARLDETEALKTFNMGIGMVLVVDAECADEVAASLIEEGERVFCIGEVVEGLGRVLYENEGGLYSFVGDDVEAPAEADEAADRESRIRKTRTFEGWFNEAGGGEFEGDYEGGKYVSGEFVDGKFHSGEFSSGGFSAAQKGSSRGIEGKAT
ncbi:MAG: phosphoribosylformylglycinamidine cyclo-ligase, partial [Eggerthellaceae bacterium]|nr:phosphoribosylformylglycinamidine cyclo-ligase [Eggerthellaceae bacterium]